jgi:uncharacterized protein
LKALGRTEVTPLEAVAICAVCFGWFILISTEAVANGFTKTEFSDRSLIGSVIYELFFALLAISILRARNYAVATLYPTPSVLGATWGVVLYAVGFGLAFVLVAGLNTGSPQPIETSLANATSALPVVVISALVNGAYEEIFLLGFLQRGLGRYGPTIAVGASLLVRILYHLYQGPMGAVWVLGFGLVMSVYFLRTGQLFPAVFAHILADIVPFVF